ncbi:GntR family transcriptional regulator [Streptomyces sp. 150FB]|uniref:GntR family transcriptional regulator n=1 Tax=Streptomyces sp. 150FB TaxID=1576605 RepID=UPI000A94F777|nr:GntR family transcriptional regulator [Streptomyces sp. 150FB]
MTGKAAEDMGSPNVYLSKSDAAYAEVRRQILSGVLAPGSRLAQYDLAESLHMSITPLREALRRLRGEGLIDLDTHRDARVAGLDAAEARQLFEIRLSLDPLAAELAADRRTDTDIAAMRGTVESLLPVTKKWGEEGLVAHRAFHQALYRASHNDALIHLLDDLWDKSDRYRRMGLHLPPGDEPRMRDFGEHRDVMELVIGGDSAGAAALMRSHIQRSLTASAIEALEVQD